MAKTDKDKLRGQAPRRTAARPRRCIEQALAEQANNDAYGVTEGGAAKRLASVGHATEAEHDDAAAQRKKASAKDDDDGGEGKSAEHKARHTPPAGRQSPQDRQHRA